MASRQRRGFCPRLILASCEPPKLILRVGEPQPQRTPYGQKNEPYSFSLDENEVVRTQHPSQQTQKSHSFQSGLSVGWDGWVRTIEMPESKSGALPLGYIPIFILLVYCSTFCSCCQAFFCFCFKFYFIY